MSTDEFKILFIEELRDIYDAEQQIVNALPNLIASSESTDLKEVLTDHLNETRNQLIRLNKIFSFLNIPAQGETCNAVQGMIKSCEKAIIRHPPSAVRDAAIITLAQRIEHYQMAVYGTLRTFAKQLEFDDFIDLLKDTLEEESNTNKKLNKIAEGGWFTTSINKKATKY